MVFLDFFQVHFFDFSGFLILILFLRHVIPHPSRRGRVGGRVRVFGGRKEGGRLAWGWGMGDGEDGGEGL